MINESSSIHQSLPKSPEKETVSESIPTLSEGTKPALTIITITFRSSYVYIVLLLLAFFLGFSMSYLIRGQTLGEETVSRDAVATIPVQNSAAEVKRYNVPVDNDPSLGPENAPITIIEFSDFECTFCRKWHLEVYPLLMANYPDKVRFVYRDFPIGGIHENAITAAEAANCANEQGAFWEFHDRLFSMGSGLSGESYTKYAKELGLDTSAFQECFSSRRYREEVQADLQFASGLGLRGTPTFFINGRPIVGAQPYEVFQQIIEQELAGATP